MSHVTLPGRRSSVTAIGRMVVMNVIFLSVSISAPSLGAQQQRAHALATRPLPSPLTIESPTAVTFQPTPKLLLRSPWWAPIASGILPGSGQFALGQQRGVVYLVAEGFFVLQAMAAQKDGDRERERYRSVASDVARKPFGGTRPVGSWAYYESMEEKLESGAFDRIPGGAIDPETDASTYNGSRWLLARETFWLNPNVNPGVGTPEYARAIAKYTREAVTDEYRWSWRDAQLQWDVYRQTIKSANRSYLRSVNLAGVVGANHLASLIDAYITVRIRRFGGAGIAGVKVDGISTDVVPIGDPAAGKRMLRTRLRIVPQ